MIQWWINFSLFLQEASVAIPLFSPVFVPMAQSIGPLLSQIASSPTVRLGVRIKVTRSFLWRNLELFIRHYFSFFIIIFILGIFHAKGHLVIFD